MISIELRDKVSCLVTEGKLFRITREHDLGNVDTEDLAFLSLGQTVEQNVVDCALSASNDSLTSIFIQVHGLIFHVDLLLELQVCLAKDEDFPFECDIDVCGGAYSREDFHSLTLAIDSGNQAQVIRGEEVDLVRVFPNELVLISLKLVTPS